MQQIEGNVRHFIVESFLFGRDNPELGNGDSLLENGVIDSTGVLELVLFLEEQFQIKVEDEELVPENLDSIDRLSSYIQRKQELQGR